MAPQLCSHIGCIWSTFLHSNLGSNNLHEKRHNHKGCRCFTFLHCVFLNVSSNCLPDKMHSRIGCICLSFLHCAFLNVPSKRLHKMMQSHIGCICLAFPHCVFSNVSANRLPEKTQSHIDYICLTFLHCAFSNVPSNGLYGKIHSRTGCTYVTFWYFQYFCSVFSRLHPPNHNFQDFAPLSMWLCFAETVASKWVKFIIDFWSSITTIVYFHCKLSLFFILNLPYLSSLTNFSLSTILVS